MDKMSNWLSHFGAQLSGWAGSVSNAKAFLLITIVFWITFPLMLLSTYLTGTASTRAQDFIRNLLHKLKFLILGR